MLRSIHYILDRLSDNIYLDVAKKIINGKRISNDECLYLLTNQSLSFLSVLANYVRERKHQKITFYNKNFHIEPTNVCVFACKFCSYSRLYKNREQGWELSMNEMLNIVKNYKDKGITEVHIVGGVHPKMDIAFFSELISNIKQIVPEIHVKAFTAVELEYMFRKSKLSYEEGFNKLINAGLDSIPGGGAEIFYPDIRKKICYDKCTGQEWLSIHEVAHNMGLHSNATMLYGHIEKKEHILDHLYQLRMLQDKTKGFKAFIPLKFRNKNNEMSNIRECSIIYDLIIYCISRIYLDNFEHVKAYWPMLGRDKAQLMQHFGVNDLDGTIDDSTKIYSMAGSEEQTPVLTSEQIQTLISTAGFEPVERNTNYKVLG